MSQSSGLLTDAGHALLSAKITANENLNISYFKLANVAGLDPEALPENYSQAEPTADIVYTNPVTRAGYINNDTVVYSLVLDSTVGDFVFNWVGLYDVDDTLVMIKYVYSQQKTGNAFGHGNNLTRNFSLKFVGAAEVTNINITAESWQFDVSAVINDRLNWTLVNNDLTAIEGFRYRLMGPYVITIPTTGTKSIYVVADANSGIGLVTPAAIAAEVNEVLNTSKGNYEQVKLTLPGVTWRIDYVNGVATI
jgi:hypothetical protein